MSDGRTEEEFFEGARSGDGPARPPRRRPESPLLARSPAIALLVTVLSGWLLHSLWPDVSYFASSRDPVDLGRPGAYRLGGVPENRFVQVRGELVDTVRVAEGRRGGTRTVGRLAGTNLLVDRPGRGGPPVFEGRLLPASGRQAYAEVAGLLRGNGTPLGEQWQVLRDGERPRRDWLPVLGAALLLAILAINVRALLRALFFFSRERR